MRAALLACLLLAGCATAEPRIITKEVLVPVVVPCVAEVGSAPRYSDTPEAIEGAPDLFERVKLLLIGRTERDARLNVLEGQISACRSAAK